ncbi:MAG: alpha,alpha-trehalase [Deltaproteobacteria bacterium]|nr:alpha,alpha-trehalase [Deltaproteobacteria bacterium]
MLFLGGQSCRPTGPSGAHGPTSSASLTRGDSLYLSPARLAPVRSYIRRSWRLLSRSHADLAAAATDSKIPHVAGQPWPVYFPPTENKADLERTLRTAMNPATWREIVLTPLPDPADTLVNHGLLYLPHPYVVPGDRFNEMYGWDSYFIVLGLLRDLDLTRAKGMADNFIYAVTHYGKVLNANRTYYLTRSQPPFLSETVRAVYGSIRDRAWLAATIPALDSTYRFWTTEPHLAGTTGLSRYFDAGSGPAPEVESGERDAAGRSHYDRVRAYYKSHDATDGYRIEDFYLRAEDRLTELFYKGDRSMRESGFDPSDRFGRFGVDVIHYAPVCLNSLLFQMEQDLAAIHIELGHPEESARWVARSDSRKNAMNRLLWDEQSGLYLDYNFQVGQRRNYPFATTFFPLWAGAASPQQAHRIQQNLRLFERPGGIVTSTTTSGSQWDAPFGWAPLQLMAVQGLRRYGHAADASRIANAWLSLVVKEFEQHQTIVEKYDVVRRESEVEAEIRYGYAANQVGFGWTNGVFLELLAR